MSSAQFIYRSAGFYPITGLYLGGTAIALVVAAGTMNLWQGIVLFAFLAVIALLFASHKELRKVHKLVNGQRAELLERIDQLTALLTESGVGVPAGGEKEQDARDDVRRSED